MVGGTTKRVPPSDSKAKRATWSNMQRQHQNQPLPNKGKGGANNLHRPRHRICVANFTLDRAVVVIEGLTVLGWVPGVKNYSGAAPDRLHQLLDEPSRNLGR